MKIIKAKIGDCNTFSFQCKRVRITLTHCPFLSYKNGTDKCSIENKNIDDIFTLPKWCPLEDFEGEKKNEKRDL